MRSLRAFLISFVLSLGILGFAAYTLANSSFSFKLTAPTLSDSTVAEETKKQPVKPGETESSEPSGADDSQEKQEIVLPTGDVTNATFLFVGTDYQPSVLDYNKSGYDENGFYVQKREVSADSLLLLKIDRSKKTFVFSSIPANAVLNQSTNKTVSKLYTEKGASYMADCVYALTGIRVEHLAVISVEDCVKAMKKVGNITYDVPCDMYYVDKTQKLEIDLKAGLQELTPKQAVNMIRFKDYPSGSNYTREKLMVEFSQSLMYKLTSPAYIGTAVSMFTDALGYFESNFTVKDFTEHMDLIFSYPNYNVKVITYPGYTKESYGEEVFIPSIGEAISAYEEYK